MAKYRIPILIEEIEKKNYHLFIGLKVKGKNCRLLVDTGASKTVFDREHVLRFVKKKHIKAYESTSVGLGVTEMQTELVKLKDLAFGNLKVNRLPVAVLDLSHVNKTYGQLGLPQIDGVLGSDFMMVHKAIIHYEKQKMTLS